MYIDQASLTTSQGQMVLEHNGQLIYWNISSYDKRCFVGDIDVTVHINEYWAQLPMFKQEKIFNIFYSIRDVFEDVYQTEPLVHRLVPLIKALFEEHKQEEIEHWLSFYSSIIIPEKLEDEYIQSDEKPGSREKTYLRNDYRRLVVLAVSLRIMIPIWGEFIYRTRKETGTYFKEHLAYYLLNESNVFNCPAIEKLMTYVIHNIQPDRTTHNIVITGVGTEEFPTWLLSVVAVRRLCVGDVSGSNPTTSLVTFIYNFINQKVTGNNTGNFATMVKGKEFESSTSDDHNASRLEGYKIKLKAPIGDIVILEHYMDDPYRVIQKLKPTANLDLLNEFIQQNKALENEQIWLPQITIAQYILRPVISPRGLTHLNKIYAITAISIAQTLLWEAGHKTLAALISAIATNNRDEMMLGGIDSKARIPKELADRIGVLYPYAKVSASKKKSKVFNSVIQAIDELASLFGQRDWIITLSDEKAKEITGHENIRRFSCPHDIKVLLAKLIIQLAESH